MNLLLTLLLQIAVILAVARAVGWIFRRFHQPQVVGEMAAGILLGPSLFGWVAPDLSAALFPPESLEYLNVLSQVGLLFFMFLVGLEFDPRMLRGRGRAAIVISHVSIVVPFGLGAALALFLYPRLSAETVPFTGFALFMGAAMSVTAFPVLARILTERNLLRTRLGALTIACAAVDDVTAWTILAFVIAIVRSTAAETPLWITLSGTLLYMGVLIFGVRRALLWLESFYHNRGRLTQDMVAGILLLLLVSSWTTEWLGIHALFGAFALGAVMPKDPGFVHDLVAKLEDVTVIFLLPLFFAFTGLRTSIGLVSGAEMWLYAGLILFVAVLGKFGGSALAARATGLPWREAGALGILMNTRGLMELVILSIGLELGVISPTLFTMMVFMALFTTFMTTPILEWLYPARLIRKSTIADDAPGGGYTVVLPVSLPGSGPGLLDAALQLIPEGLTPRVYALHLERTSDQSLTRVDARRSPAHDEVLIPLLNHARVLGVEVRPLSFTSRDVAKGIVEVAHAKVADLVLIGWHKPIIGESILSGTVSDVLREARADVAVFVERNAAPWRRILVPFEDAAVDGAALGLAQRIAGRSGAEVTVMHLVSEDEGLGEPTAKWGDARFPAGVRVELVEEARPQATAALEADDGYDLIVVGVSPTWGTVPTLFGRQHEVLARRAGASLLVIRPDTSRTPDDGPATGATTILAALR